MSTVEGDDGAGYRGKDAANVVMVIKDLIFEDFLKNEIEISKRIQGLDYNERLRDKTQVLADDLIERRKKKE